MPLVGVSRQEGTEAALLMEKALSMLGNAVGGRKKCGLYLRLPR